MPENTSRVPVVRCPKCAHLLPELPRYSVYRCGGCGGLLRADKESSVTDNLSENSWETRSSGSSRREGNGGRVVGVDLARKSPMRSRYPDATRKSPMRERNLGDFDGGIDPSRGNGRRTPARRASKSPVRSRYVDASRKSPMRERNFGALDGHRKSPLRGRMSGDFDAQSKFSGRSTDADARKSPLRSAMRQDVLVNPEEIQARDKVGAWVEHVKEEVGYVNKLITPTESFSGWLPGDETANQNQIELNKPSASPRKRRTRRTEDPKQRPEPISEIEDQIDDENGNIYGRRHAEVSYDDWVEEDDYGRARGNTNLRYQDGYVEVFERPRGRREHWEAERIGFQGVRRNGIPPGVRHRVPIDSYEPPSNYRSGSNYSYDELRGRSRYNAPANIQNVAIKQEEILRKYNELGEYIERIGDLAYNQGGRGDFYGDADDYVHDEFLRVRRGTVQSSGRNESPRMRHGYITGHPGHNESRYYHQEFAPRLAPRRPMDPTYDPRTENLHHPTYNLQDVKHSPASVYDYKTHPNRQTHGMRTQDSKFHNPTPNNLSSNSRTSVESKSDGSSIAYDHAKKVLVSQNQQLCHPISGGAPFVICSKCSQLLRIPGKLRATKMNQCRLQCGSCRTISSFNFDKKRSHSSLQSNSKPNATDELVNKSDDKNSVTGNRNRESFDFKNTGYTFPGSDSEPSTELEDRRLNSSEIKMRPGLSPSSSNASKEDKFSEAVGQTDASSSKEEKPLTKLPLLRPPPGSPLRYHLDYSDMLAANESVGKETDASRQDAAVPNKLNLNSNEIPKAVASQGSTDVSIRNVQGFQFQDPSLPSLNVSHAKADVFVNGQPITRDAVKSAEKMAGTISPGVYWYDKRAGFWGLMGSHCLGIIVPFIKEFKAPMPENCSGGDTCIYVNGRELHKNDLDLLSTRGLPRTRYKYYIVDISGKVEDEDTARFVVNLGKFAPNVERSGRGFGMQPPEMHNA